MTERNDEHCCFICEQPFKAGEMVLQDVTEGLGHRSCFGEDREGYVHLDTGNPLADGDPLPTGFPYDPAELADPAPTERKVSSERVSEERLRNLKERAGLKCMPTQMTYEARKAANGLPSEINEHFFARNWEDKPHRVVFDLCEEIEHLSELLALRSSVKTVGPTPDQVLDAANDYAMEQYGIGFLSHPVDRQRILSAIEAPAAEGEKRELTAVEELAVSMTDEKIANALDEECETILQLLIYSREGEIASHVGAIKSWTGMLRGRAERMPKARPSPAAASEVTDAMVDAAHEAIEQSYRTESWEFGPPSSLARSILTAALKRDRP